MESLEASSRRLLRLAQLPPDGLRDNPPRTPKRVRLILHTTPREIRSPSPESLFEFDRTFGAGADYSRDPGTYSRQPATYSHSYFRGSASYSRESPYYSRERTLYSRAFGREPPSYFQESVSYSRGSAYSREHPSYSRESPPAERGTLESFWPKSPTPQSTPRQPLRRESASYSRKSPLVESGTLESFWPRSPTPQPTLRKPLRLESASYCREPPLAEPGNPELFQPRSPTPQSTPLKPLRRELASHSRESASYDLEPASYSRDPPFAEIDTFELSWPKSRTLQSTTLKAPRQEPEESREFSFLTPKISTLKSPTPSPSHRRESEESRDLRDSTSEISTLKSPTPSPSHRRETEESRELRASTSEISTLKSPTPSPSHSQESEESRALGTPSPEMSTLESSNPGPSKAIVQSSHSWLMIDIDNEPAEMPPSRSSTATLPVSSEFVHPVSDISRSWPVDSREGLNEVIVGSARAYTRASPMFVRPLVEPKPIPQLPLPLFCCADLKMHLRTNPIMPTDLKKIHGPIIDTFISNINPAFEEQAILSEDEFKAIDRIIKVNRVISGEEISTRLFLIGEKELSFKKLADMPRAVPFNPQGKGSYQSYCCGKHRTMYRVGVYDKTFKTLYNRWSFGDIGLDVALGLISDCALALEKFEAMLRTE